VISGMRNLVLSYPRTVLSIEFALVSMGFNTQHMIQPSIHAPNKRMQPTHQPGHQICMRKFVACLAGV
jgi:hypothetical protein